MNPCPQRTLNLQGFEVTVVPFRAQHLCCAATEIKSLIGDHILYVNALKPPLTPFFLISACIKDSGSVVPVVLQAYIIKNDAIRGLNKFTNVNSSDRTPNICGRVLKTLPPERDCNNFKVRCGMGSNPICSHFCVFPGHSACNFTCRTS